MYSSASEWFACNYTYPKRINNTWFDDEVAPSGLETQYERLVTGNLMEHEYDNYYGIKNSFCGYLGEILLCGGLNWYMRTYYPGSGLIARLATWKEDTSEKMDVVLFPEYDPALRLGIQVKLSKNSQSRIYGQVPVLGLKVGGMNLGMEDLMGLHGSDPPYLVKPGRFINERFNYDQNHSTSFTNTLLQQAGHILRRTCLADIEENHPLGGAFRALCGYNF